MNRRFAWLVGFGAAVAVATACASLESTEPGVCGNGGIEGAEDCDEPEGVAARAGGACVRAGDLNACHYTCDTAADCPVLSCSVKSAAETCTDQGGVAATGSCCE